MAASYTRPTAYSPWSGLGHLLNLSSSFTNKVGRYAPDNSTVIASGFHIDNVRYSILPKTRFKGLSCEAWEQLTIHKPIERQLPTVVWRLVREQMFGAGGRLGTFRAWCFGRLIFSKATLLQHREIEYLPRNGCRSPAEDLAFNLVYVYGTWTYYRVRGLKFSCVQAQSTVSPKSSPDDTTIPTTNERWRSGGEG
ncbi:hypothetical protein BDM02DRAFT_3130573 [Thelephora ganbajun]|uniref:Uncharacterized protein n=1 Tax=Thelephora ganbajun TaxID=370292 RepID=A0ACB6ZAG2_THEGA|nr:hypothetical protein BDM02DRAFT_3130573 [Thelephora ganbajun]